MRPNAGVVSDCGHVRSANEDSFILRPRLYAVCDGMGGARAGEVASQMACLGLVGVDPASAGVEELKQAIVEANKAIVRRSTTESELLGMGTTMTAALLTDESLLVAHVGDSRAYLLHGDKLSQVTDDHSWVGEMVRRGELTPEQAARHPHRSVITKALGTDMILEPDVLELPVEPGDRVLLCSDGLTGMVGDKTIAGLMSAGTDAQATAQSLVDAALENGGDDNVTVLVIDIEASGEGEDDEQSLWADSRILIGPSDREAKASSAARGVERLSLAARERLRRRGQGVLRPGSRSTMEWSEDSRVETGKGEAAERGVAAGAGSAGKTDTTDGEATRTATSSTKKGRQGQKAGSVTGGRRGRRRWLTVTVVALLILVIAVGGFAWYNSTVYYLGDDDGKVALYRGLPWEFLGIEFSSVYAVSSVYYRDLSPFDKTRVDSHELLGKDEGTQSLDGLSTGS